ncbi:HAD superfamily hydrolase (TIGR01509 family) [Mycetocola sp. BIGb0189]|uniref:HAD family hydrolase n=1 Tax=Mycetocola sp. BIGb0189 TaxID=2940604 RepID=UPI0021693281|nr:HAD family phosphatase [Mycetocola sp. BIGb0189]MCS4277060.1 HAD superfamily hydrolase (TIGR01509 family) [Mycetocola sp. BIGb0189]
MTTQLPAAVLWDMDGTLVDTEPYWIATERELVGSYGGTWTEEDALQMVGSGLWECAAVLQSKGVALELDEIVATMTGRVIAKIEEHGVPFRPGALELLRELRENNVPTALVTMSIRTMAEKVIDMIDFPAFDALVTGDSVTHAKPHPEPYLLGAEALGVDIRACVALEDSLPGITSAAAAGTTAIVVPHATQVAENPDFTVWPTLEGVTLDDLSALVWRRTTLNNTQEISS